MSNDAAQVPRSKRFDRNEPDFLHISQRREANQFTV